MSNTESTFADRLGRASLLKQIVEGFIPAFIPGDSSLTPANFETFNDTLSAKNTEVGWLRGTYTTKTSIRNDMVIDLKDRSKRTRDFVVSVKSLEQFHLTAKRLVVKITSFRSGKSTASTEPNNQDNQAKRNKGEQSFAEIANNFKALISLVTNIGAPYTPASPDLTVVNLTALHGNLVSQNEQMGELLGVIAVSVKERKDLYNGDNGLRDKMKAIKNAVKSQYKADSPQYLSVKGIKV